MIIYILHEKYMSTFKLPKKVSGTFFIQDVDSNSNPTNLVTVFCQNGKLYMKSNDFIQIIAGHNKIDCCELVLNSTYLLMTRTGDSIVLYTRVAYDNNYIIGEVKQDGVITVGRDKTCDISLNVAGLEKKQFQLIYKNHQCIIKNLNDSIPLYCNNLRVNECVVDNYDTIFVMGFRMVVCGRLLYLSNNYNRIGSMTDKITVKNSMNYAIANVDTGTQVYNDFYKADDYFSKSPTFVKKVEPYTLDIIQPKPEEKLSSFSVFIDLVPSVLMSATSLLSGLSLYKEYKAGTTTKEAMTSSIIMIAVMLFASIVWPIISHFISKTMLFINNKEYNFKYKRYIKKVAKDLEAARKQQKEALVYNNLSLQDCQNSIMEKDTNLFSITANQDRFLNVRLGVGQVKMDANINFTSANEIETKSKFEKGVKKLIEKYKYIDGVPYAFSLKNSVAFINDEGNFDSYLKAIILQLITLYDCYCLKLVVFTSDKSKLKIIKNLKNCWSLDESVRYFATNSQEAEVISSNLIRIMNENEVKAGDKANAIKTHYLIISDEITKYRNLKIVEKILDSTDYLGFSCLFFAQKINEVPSGCQYFLAYTDETANLLQLEVSDGNYETFKPEFLDDSIDFAKCVSTVADIPVVSNLDSTNNGALPDKLGFLEMFNVGNVQQLNCVNRWQTSQVVNTLATPVGIDTTGNTLYLDLHEKAHGPHGLIAGMTGSGKSETIVTYVLSLAVNYSPNEVQFVLIDYKGGGLAGAFENRKTGLKLPHLVGTITNLDKSSMNRTLVSIKSELQRRQRVFNEAKENLDIASIDIYKYQELVRAGSIKDPMAHLFIICDEFAELKAQQPEFMDELVSAARIGRSLGIHLILATQKPSGVVDDQIWSNSKFKICAKVQTAEDSNEMIRKPDAAYIKESGRFYLQVGYDEIFVKAQSGYTGVKYVPHETAFSSGGSDSNAISVIDHLGNVIKTTTVEEKTKVVADEDLGDELSNVTRYLIECAKSIGYQNQQLWLDNVPEQLYYPDLVKKYPFTKRPYILEVPIGEYDDPANQKQGVVKLNFNEGGNTFVLGTVGSGKTTLLSSIIYSLIINYATTEVNIYVIDYVSGILKKYADAPQVAEVVTASESDKAKKLFFFLKREYERRLRILSASGKDFMYYINSGKPVFPTIVIFLNGYDALYEKDYDFCDETVNALIRESSRVGMYFVTTTAASNVGRIEDYFSQKIVYQVSDPTEYSEHFTNYDRALIPASNPGRGVAEADGAIHEFQTTLLYQEKEEESINYIIEQLKTSLPKAKGMPVMPKIITTKDIISDDMTLESVPVGIEIASNCVCPFNFNNLVNLILYNDPVNGTDFSKPLVSIMKEIKNLTVIWLDGLNVEEEIEGVKKFNNNFNAVCSSLHKTILEKKVPEGGTPENIIVFVVTDYSSINKHLNTLKKENPDTINIDDLIMASADACNYKFILFDSAGLKSIDNKPWVDYFDYDRGIILATDPDEQEILSVATVYGETKYTRDIATVVNKSDFEIIKFIRR